MNARKSISNKRRFDTFKRDGFVCQYCGAHPPDVILEIDHIIPVSEGGDDEVGNLVTSCFECNRGKRNHSLATVPDGLAKQAAEVHEREVQLAGYREVMQARQDRIENDKWRVADALIEDSSSNGMRRDWLQSIKRFNESLDLHEVLEAAEIARAKSPYASERKQFLYFCGVCWNKIRQKHDRSEN